MTEFQDKHISGCSTKLSKEMKLKDHFDLFIFSDIGSEYKIPKLAEYISDSFEFTQSVLLSVGFRKKECSEKDEDNLVSFIRNICDSEFNCIIEHEKCELEKMEEDIRFILEQLIKTLKKPLNIGFDITNCPPYLFISIMKFCLENRLSKNISFFYSKVDQLSFSKNSIIQIESKKVIDTSDLRGGFNPENKQVYLISLGHDEINYKNLITEYESECMRILLPESDFDPKATKNMEEIYQFLNEDFEISADDIIRVPEDDAIVVWKVLRSSILYENESNHIYVIIGPKPHALAIGVHGFLYGNIIITYENEFGDDNSVRSEKLNDAFWRYDIENLSLI